MVCPPDKVGLASGQAFSSLEVDGSPPIWLGGVDIAGAFYQIELPSELRDMFGLPPILARHVGVSATVSGPVGPSETIIPCFRGVPMGWSQSLWICQSIHELIAQRVPCDPC